MARPFIRCAGGKRLLAPRILALFPQPAKVKTYIEPFLGGGAVFFEAAKVGRINKSVLGDADADLIALFKEVRDHPRRLIKGVNELVAVANEDHPATVYEHERDLWNADATYRTPIRHLFLRHQAWNGLWRTNKGGMMNTPWRKETPKPIDGDAIMAASRALIGTVLRPYHFSLHTPAVGDVVYCDPPYITENGFTGYCPGGWGTEDLDSLLQTCRKWSDDGVHVILSHADTTDAWEQIKRWWPKAKITQVESRRSINADGANRGPVSELLISTRRKGK